MLLSPHSLDSGHKVNQTNSVAGCDVTNTHICYLSLFPLEIAMNDIVELL